MQNGKNLINPLGIIELQGMVFERFQHIALRNKARIAFHLMKGSLHHETIREAQLGEIERSAKLIEADVIDVQDVRRNEVVPAFGARDAHARSEDKDVLFLHVVEMGQEIVDALDFVAHDPAAINDRVIAVDVLPFIFLQRENVPFDARGDVFRVFFGPAGCGGIKNESSHSERILP